ncbi:MAG: Flp pilus assembly protein CpaB [Acidobacteria bacterium]|nr:MAG: Flp pilus assembly protein CpaB [Acidobacteriota bacterium]PYS14837.1 MAG: Flp pilus assembly protein CpaB [Acidobacteriota bacterium]
MQRHRVLVAFGIAWLTALLLSWWVYKKTTAPQARDVISVAAAAHDLAIGKRIQTDDLKMVTLDRKDLPRGVFVKASDVVDRAVAVPIFAGEIVLNGKLAAKGSGEGLTALIEPGMRAVSVQVNEISGVSGFIQPGTRVDVLFTRTFSNGDAATTTILQNIKVVAYGRQLDASAKLESRDTTRPTVATLLVTQEEAQKVVLAQQRGRIQLVLRNGLDDKVDEFSDPIAAADLGIEEPRKPQPPPVRPVPPPDPVVRPSKAAKADEDAHTVRIYRGDKMTEEKVK